jgi:hypothetical protein
MVVVIFVPGGMVKRIDRISKQLFAGCDSKGVKQRH